MGKAMISVSLEKLNKLQCAADAYELALEHDYCPAEDSEFFGEDTEEWSGCRPDEIANDICRIINLLT